MELLALLQNGGQGQGQGQGADLLDACGETPGFLCETVLEWTDNTTIAGASDWLIEKPLRIIIILLIGWVLNRLARRAIAKVVDRVSSTSTEETLRSLQKLGPKSLQSDPVMSRARSKARAETVGLVLRSIASILIWSVAALVILAEFDVDLAPLIAGAGIAGVALGFGAQSLVKDFLTGLFMLIEDQYGVGDIIDAGEAMGTVEQVSLRTTTLRDLSGTVWHIPNGEITRVGNFSQLWSCALMDVDVAYGTDVRFAEGVIQRVANDMWQDPEWGGDVIISEPEVWGVQALGADGVSIRIVIRTQPSAQWRVERELRLRLKEAFDEAGIEIPFPQRTVWFRNEGDVDASEAVDPSSVPTAPLVDATDDAASGNPPSGAPG